MQRYKFIGIRNFSVPQRTTGALPQTGLEQEMPGGKSLFISNMLDG